MTRVLHVLEAIEAGTSRHVIDVVRHAKGLEHEVVVPPRRVGGLTDETAIDRLEAAGATVHLLPMRRTPWAPRNAESLARLVALIRRRRPDIVHGHSSIGGLLARLAATSTRTPRFYTANGVTNVRAGQLVERRLARLTDRWIAVSTSEGELAVESGYARASTMVVVPNGIEVDAPPPIDLHELLGLDRATPLIGTIARLVPQKAPLDFVALCRHLASLRPELRFVLIGGGEQQTEFDAAIDAAGLRALVFQVQALPGAAAALSSLTVFVLTSRFEGGPYAPLEAMRAGTPVVLTDVVGNRDSVEPGISGLLAPAGDPRAMAEAVAELVGDDARRAALAAAGLLRVREQFDVRVMGQRMAALYEEVSAASA